MAGPEDVSGFGMWLAVGTQLALGICLASSMVLALVTWL